MPDIANFLAQNSPRFRRSDIEREHMGNALMRQRVQAEPQMSRLRDLDIQGAELDIKAGQQQIGDNQKANAAGLLAQRFAAVAQSENPLVAGRQFLSDPNFKAAGQMLGLPIDQFSITDGDNPEQIRQSAADWARALGTKLQGDQARVQSTQVLEDGTIAYITSDGQLVRTNERARETFTPIEVAGGRAAFNRGSGTVAPITSAAEENQAAADRAAATTGATERAQTSAAREGEQAANARTLEVWQVARQGLMNALGSTDTGPIAGRIPAVTAEQQTAEGAIAAVAPVLKQLFRSAGEGIFTDRDQQLLLDMVPKRTDHPQSAKAKVEMIDAIIAAKLSAGQPSAPAPASNRIRVDAQGNVIAN